MSEEPEVAPPEAPDPSMVEAQVAAEAAPTRPMPTLPDPNVGLRTGRPVTEPWRPKWWNRSAGPVVYEYDWLDWVIRLVFFAVGLLLGFLIWHGLHFSFSL